MPSKWTLFPPLPLERLLDPLRELRQSGWAADVGKDGGGMAGMVEGTVCGREGEERIGAGQGEIRANELGSR